MKTVIFVTVMILTSFVDGISQNQMKYYMVLKSKTTKEKIAIHEKARIEVMTSNHKLYKGGFKIFYTNGSDTVPRITIKSDTLNVSDISFIKYSKFNKVEQIFLVCGALFVSQQFLSFISSFTGKVGENVSAIILLGEFLLGVSGITSDTPIYYNNEWDYMIVPKNPK